MAQMFFNEIEAAKIAQNMERNGMTFYQRWAGRSGNQKVRDLFLQLAEDEKQHLATFEELEEILQTERRGRTGYTDDADLGAYIDRLLQTQVFADSSDVTRMAEEAADDLAAIAVGMKAERDSILFYQEMLDFLDSKAAKDAFTYILKEERRHLQLLGDRAEDCSE